MASKDIIQMVIKIKDEASAKLKALGGAASKASDDLDDLEGSAEGAGGGFDVMSAASSPAAMGVLAVAGAAVTAATAIFALAKGSSDYVDMIQFVANETTLSTKTILALESATGAAGVEFGTAKEALKGLSARMKEGNKQADQSETVFGKLGIALKDASGESRSADDVFRDSLDTIRLIPNEADRAAASMDIFGESGSRLLPIIEGGTDGLDAWGEAAAAAGKVIDEDALKASADFDAAMTSLNNSIDGVILTLGTDLTPSVVIMVEAFADAISSVKTLYGWMKRLAEATDVLGVLSLIPDAAPSGGGGAVAGGAGEEARAQALALSMMQGPDGKTDGQRADERTAKREAFKAAAQADLKKSSARKSAGPAVDEFAGQNAFNALVDQLFGAQVVADAAAVAVAQEVAATNLAAYNAMIDEGIDAQSEARVAAELLAKAETDAAKAADMAAAADIRAARGEAFSIGGGGLESTMGGGVVGILSALGPQGAIAANVLSLGMALPDLLSSLSTEIDDIIVTLITELPAALITALPEIWKSMMIDLPIALAEAFDSMLRNLFKIFAPKKEKQDARRQERRGKQQDRLAKKFGETEGFQDRGFLVRALGNMFANDQPNESFASGGFVGRSGMAMVHRGEEITPQNGVRSSGQNQRMGGGTSGGGTSITINVTGLLDPSGADRLVELLNRSIGSRGFGVASVN